MDIEKALLKEHSKKQKDAIIRYIGNNPARFKELMTCFFKGDYRLTQRAAWPMSDCAKLHPELVKPYFARLVACLKRKDMHPAVERNITRLLEDVVIPEKWQGEIMDYCIRAVADINAAIAVKAYSITILENLARLYPEILPELTTIIEERWDQEGPAFKARARHLRNRERK
jgi:hypothetical protein